MKDPIVSTLGQDPVRNHRINANSFQQDAIITAFGWQYATFYTNKIQGQKDSPLFVNLARRRVGNAYGESGGQVSWDIITFEDYEQTVDDGHNAISIGVCKGDGTIHVSFDHHCDPLKFRISQAGVALDPASHEWKVNLFSKTQNNLPGIPSHSYLNEVSYPAFVSINNNLILCHRIGQAGLGSSVLYHYNSNTHLYTALGTLLTGISNSPYVNGFSISHEPHSRLHISFCYRSFIPYGGSGDSNSVVHKVQAGPNGPENNEGLYHIYNDDEGITWHGTTGDVIATLTPNATSPSSGSPSTTILPSTPGICAFPIPTHSGILNQEAQAADSDGGFHVLNRENASGRQEWMHYYRAPTTGAWSRRVLVSPERPTETGERGALAGDQMGGVYAVLQGNEEEKGLCILRAAKEGGFKKWELLWRGTGFDGEPLVDVGGIAERGVLSIFTRTDGSGDVHRKRQIVVLEFELAEGGDLQK